MKRLLLLIAALLFAVEITIPDAAAGPFGLFNRTIGGSQSACANGQCNAPSQAGLWHVSKISRPLENNGRLFSDGDAPETWNK